MVNKLFLYIFVFNNDYNLYLFCHQVICLSNNYVLSEMYIFLIFLF